MSRWRPADIEAPPRTVKEAVARLMLVLSDSGKAAIRDLPADDLFTLHFDLGLLIRNAFGLHGRNPDLLDDCGCAHPDDASAVIIDALRKALQSGE